MGDSRHCPSRGTPRVLVLMAAYNGARTLEAQVASILAQEGVRVAIAIRDDGSEDATLACARRLAAGHPEITVTQNPRNLGIAETFMGLVGSVRERGFDYYAFADDDDLWHPGKLARAVSTLEAAHGIAGAKRGRLYYSDVRHVDRATGRALPSEAAKFIGHEREFSTLLVSNWAAGCTMVFDEPLRRLLCRARPARYPRIHDAWVHLVALSSAMTVPDLEFAGIDHLVGASNATVGRVDRGFGSLSAKRLRSALAQLPGERTHPFADAAAALLSLYAPLMDAHDRELASLLAALPSSAPLRARTALAGPFHLPGATEDALLRARILMNRL